MAIKTRRNGQWAIEMPNQITFAEKTPARMEEKEIITQEERTPEQEAYFHLLKFSGAIFVFVCCFIAVGFVITVEEHQGTPHLLGIADQPDFQTPDLPDKKEFVVPPKAEILLKKGHDYEYDRKTGSSQSTYIVDGVGIGTEKHSNRTSTTKNTTNTSTGDNSKSTRSSGTSTTNRQSNSMTGFGENPDKNVSEKIHDFTRKTANVEKVDGKVQKLDTTNVTHTDGEFAQEITKKDNLKSHGIRGAEFSSRKETKNGYDTNATGDSEPRDYKDVTEKTSLAQGEYFSRDSKKGRVSKLDAVDQVYKEQTQTKHMGNGQEFTSNEKDVHEHVMKQKGPTALVGVNEKF